MADPFRFQGGIAVITGAASGIGTGLVKAALARDMKVVAADINAEALGAFARGLKGDVLAVPTDVSLPASVDALAAKAYDAFGRVDLLFNNAGILPAGLSWEIEPERWQKAFGVNVHGVVHGIRSFVPRMLKTGAPAHIVNTASIGGFFPSPLMSPYTATKFAVVAITEALFGELQMLKAPIRASLLAPGPVKTGIFNDPFGPQAGEAAQHLVIVLRKMLTENGLTPDEFGTRVFDGIQKNLFWIIPQPEFFDHAYRVRSEEILARKDPRQVPFD